MKKLTKKKEKTIVKIPWSIHYCVKFSTISYKETNNVMGSSTDGYMTVRTVGRKKVKKMHKTLGSAFNEVGL